MQIKIQLGLQAALNGWVGHETRLVEASWTREKVSVIVYTHGDLDKELVEEFRNEVVKCLTPTLDTQHAGLPVIDTAFVRLDDPQPIRVEGIVIFMRR